MQAIITKYHGPSNTQPARIIAKCWLGRVVHNWNCELGLMGNHTAAAAKLIIKLNNDRKKAGHDDYIWMLIASGNMPDNSGNAFVIDLIPNNAKEV